HTRFGAYCTTELHDPATGVWCHCVGCHGCIGPQNCAAESAARTGLTRGLYYQHSRRDCVGMGIPGDSRWEWEGPMSMIRRVRAAILTAIVLSSATSTVAAAERYYVLIFVSQSHPKQLRYTHTWATFVRA